MMKIPYNTYNSNMPNFRGARLADDEGTQFAMKVFNAFMPETKAQVNSIMKTLDAVAEQNKADVQIQIEYDFQFGAGAIVADYGKKDTLDHYYRGIIIDADLDEDPLREKLQEFESVMIDEMKAL